MPVLNRFGVLKAFIALPMTIRLENTTIASDFLYKQRTLPVFRT